MVGSCLNNDKSYRKLRAWIDDSIRSDHRKPFITSHVDEFLGEISNRHELLDKSLDLLHELVKASVEQKIIEDFTPLLVVSLEASENILFWNRSVSVVEEMIEEPPALYLVSRMSNREGNQYQEYKFPIHLELVDFKKYNFDVYYRCWRDRVGIENNWEYSRAIYIHGYE